MSTLALVLFTMLMTSMAFGQGSTVFLNEVSISVNRTVVGDDNTNDLFGCGIGLSRVVFNRRNFFLNAGLEYNFTRQRKDRTYEGRFAHAEQVTYDLHFLTVPLTVRYDMGKKVRFFIEAGGFVDFMVHSWRKGTIYLRLPGSGGQLSYDSRPFGSRAGVSDPNYGCLAGLGLRIPMAQQGYIVIKTDYRIGFNSLLHDAEIHNRYVRLSVGWNGMFRKIAPLNPDAF